MFLIRIEYGSYVQWLMFYTFTLMRLWDWVTDKENINSSIVAHWMLCTCWHCKKLHIEINQGSRSQWKKLIEDRWYGQEQALF